MSPACAEFEPPPLRPVREVNRVPGRREDERARLQHVRQCAGIIFRVGCNVGDRCIAGCPDELVKLAVCYERAINPEWADRDVVNRRLFRVVSVGSHTEGAAWNSCHARIKGRFDHRGISWLYRRLVRTQEHSPVQGSSLSLRASLTFSDGPPQTITLWAGYLVQDPEEVMACRLCKIGSYGSWAELSSGISGPAADFANRRLPDSSPAPKSDPVPMRVQGATH